VSEPFDIVPSGHTSGDDASADRERVVFVVDVGATWWLEDLSPWAFGWYGDGSWPVAAMRLRVRRGPARCALESQAKGWVRLHRPGTDGRHVFTPRLSIA